MTIATINVINIRKEFDIITQPEMPWQQITKSECHRTIKYLCYGVHYGAQSKYENFLFWKCLKLENGQTSFKFDADIPAGNGIMIEIMGYSKHINMGNPYNVLEYYIVKTGIV